MMHRLWGGVGELLLLICFLFVWSDAAQLMDFPGSMTCLDSGLQIEKPKGIPRSVWQTLHVVDSSGLEVDGCQITPDGSWLTIPERCISHETGRLVAHISFNDSMENNAVYQISCDYLQADPPYRGPIIDCNQQYMMATIPRRLPAFDDEVISTPPPIPSWTVVIKNGTDVKVDVSTAKTLGYTLTSDDDNLMIRADLKAIGLKQYTSQGQKLFIGDLVLIQKKQRITIDVKLICATGPPACNTTHMTLAFPPESGSLQHIYIGQKAVPMTIQQGMTLDTRGGIQLSIALEKLQALKDSSGTTYSLSNLTLVFDVDGLDVPMTISPRCFVAFPNTPCIASCTADGLMSIEVFARNTTPILDLTTVTVRDRTCRPEDISPSRIAFRFPLNSCGTTKRYEGGRIFYENEVSALWRNLPPRSISRDTELRETVRCYFNGSVTRTLNVTVSTLPPPASTRHDGPIVFVMNIYPDLSYQMPYRDDQYPIVKTLREPIFIEVQVLNRNDPNIELVLDDCWATMSQDPNASPQWNVVVDGCQESQDNYLTVFHPVNINVPQATHRKWFEVKAFAFMEGGELSTNLVYFHCSAIICNIQSPDSPLCTKKCPQTRSKRDLFLKRNTNLASPPGPIFLLNSEPSMSFEDENVIKVIIGALPAIVLIAVIVLFTVLITFKRKSKL
ncbi:zona pellucida sperm-binding protein 2-like [Dendropsophus ebraccatus]|uniref:zona pellucida sperm-binding protein 2-like n=1 Tax=Dendropsophus ebraccatus TaxID=150705 RepID=UPI003831EA4C